MGHGRATWLTHLGFIAVDVGSFSSECKLPRQQGTHHRHKGQSQGLVQCSDATHQVGQSAAGLGTSTRGFWASLARQDGATHQGLDPDDLYAAPGLRAGPGSYPGGHGLHGHRWKPLSRFAPGSDSTAWPAPAMVCNAHKFRMGVTAARLTFQTRRGRSAGWHSSSHHSCAHWTPADQRPRYEGHKDSVSLGGISVVSPPEDTMGVCGRAATRQIGAQQASFEAGERAKIGQDCLTLDPDEQQPV
jgi:hypothetical protein